MITKQELYQIKTTNKWPVKFSDFYCHYFILIFPLGGIFIGAMELYSGIKNELFDLKVWGLTELIIFTVMLVFILKRLYENHLFKEYYLPDLRKENIADILKSVGFQNVRYYKDDYFQCTSSISWFSWGEIITIVYNDKNLLINSRPHSQPITIIKDKNNIKNIVTAVQR